MKPEDEPKTWRNFESEESWQHLRKVAVDMAYGIVGPAYAQDVAQATLAAYGIAMEAIHNPEAWVTRVAANMSINLSKRRRREVLAEPDVLQGLGEEGLNGEPDEFDRLVAKILVKEMLDLLPDQQRATLALRYGAGLERAEIAEILGVAIETVKTHMKRGMSHLRRKAGQEQEESHDDQ